MSTNFARRIICPICKQPGYIVREKPRKKHETSTLRKIYKLNKIPYHPKSNKRQYNYQIRSADGRTYIARNNIHSDYTSETRKTSKYFRIKHNRLKKPFCYVGDPLSSLKRLEKSLKILQGEKFYYRIEDWPSRLKKITNAILERKVEERDIRFFVRIKRESEHPQLLIDQLQAWLKAMLRRKEEDVRKKSEELAMVRLCSI